MDWTGTQGFFKRFLPVISIRYNNKKRRKIMENKKQKKQANIWQIVFIVSLAVSLPKFSSYLPDFLPSIFISALLGGLGAVLGVLIARVLKNSSTVLKSFSFVCCMVVIFSSLMFIPKPPKVDLFNKELINISNLLNKQCPIVLDQDTRLDTTSTGPGNSLTYYYTLVNYQKNEIDSDKFIKLLKPNILNNAKTNKDMENFRKNKVELIYVYRDKNNIEAFRIVLPPNEYI